MLESAPLVTLGFAYFFYLISKEFEDDIKHLLLFIGCLFVPYTCFITGRLSDVYGESIIATLCYSAAFITSLLFILLFSLYTFYFLTELKKQKGAIKI